MSFRLKTILGIAAIESVLLLVLILSGLNFLSESNEEQLRQRAETTSRLFANATKDAVLATDLATLESFVEEILGNPDIVYTRISSNGIILAEGGDTAVLAMPHPPDNGLDGVDDGIFDVHAEIREGDTIYGIIEMGLSTSAIEQLLRKAKHWTISIAGLEVTLVAIFSFILGTYLTRQLQRLKSASETITQSGPGHQVAILGNDEIAEVAQAFNAMSSSLQRSYDELHLAAQAFESSEAMFITDAKGNIIRANSALTRITGYETDEVIGENPRIFSSGRQDALFYQSMWQQLLAEGKWSGEICNKRKSGDIFPEHLNISAVKDARGGTTHYIAHFVDISEQKRNETRLRMAQHEAEKANEAKSRFLATMSHEIRSPLNAVINMNLLLQESDLDPQQRHYAEIARQGGETLMLLINDILDFSKIESGKLQLAEEWFDATTAVKGVVELLSGEAQAKGFNLTFEMTPGLYTHYLGDEMRLRQILINLAGNAIKFTEFGEVSIRLCAMDGKSGLQLEVEDSGIGIPPEQQARIFGEFIQAEDQDNRRFGGSGLGLTIVQRLVTLMKGTLSLHSEVSKGSHFTLLLPLQGRNISTTEKGNKDTPSHFTTPSTGASGGEILLVEDSQTNQAVALALLQPKGYRISLANNGKEALEIAKQRHFDLILMDLSMPVMDGLEATRKLRGGNSINSKTPIMAMTANAFTEDRERCFAAGMNDYLSKPLDRRLFYERLHYWLGDGESEDKSTTAMGEHSPSEASELLDHKVLQQLAHDTSWQILPDILQIYFDETHSRVPQMLQFFADKAWPQLSAEAHALKSSSGSFGAVQLQAVASEIELAVKASDTTSIEHHMTSLESLAADSVEALQLFITTERDG
ncbi:MAG: ATP-binding protein [Sedimenticola sp.]